MTHKLFARSAARAAEPFKKWILPIKMTKRAPKPPRTNGDAYLQHGTSKPKKLSFVVGLSYSKHNNYIEILTELKGLMETDVIKTPSEAKQWVKDCVACYIQ